MSRMLSPLSYGPRRAPLSERLGSISPRSGRPLQPLLGGGEVVGLEAAPGIREATRRLPRPFRIVDRVAPPLGIPVLQRPCRCCQPVQRRHCCESYGQTVEHVGGALSEPPRRIRPSRFLQGAVVGRLRRGEPRLPKEL